MGVSGQGFRHQRPLCVDFLRGSAEAGEGVVTSMYKGRSTQAQAVLLLRPYVFILETKTPGHAVAGLQRQRCVCVYTRYMLAAFSLGDSLSREPKLRRTITHDMRADIDTHAKCVPSRPPAPSLFNAPYARIEWIARRVDRHLHRYTSARVYMCVRW